MVGYNNSAKFGVCATKNAQFYGYPPTKVTWNNVYCQKYLTTYFSSGQSSDASIQTRIKRTRYFMWTLSIKPSSVVKHDGSKMPAMAAEDRQVLKLSPTFLCTRPTAKMPAKCSPFPWDRNFLPVRTWDRQRRHRCLVFLQPGLSQTAHRNRTRSAVWNRFSL